MAGERSAPRSARVGRHPEHLPVPQTERSPGRSDVGRAGAGGAARSAMSNSGPSGVAGCASAVGGGAS